MLLLQLCVGSLGFLFLYVLFILVVLKEDGYSPVAVWTWGEVLMIPSIASFLFFIIFFCLQYFSAGPVGIISSSRVRDESRRIETEVRRFSNFESDSQKRRLLSDWNRSQDEASSFLHGMDIEGLRSYHESVIFRSILLIFSYAVFLVFHSFALVVPCSRCTTPYHALAIGWTVVYGLRLLLEMVTMIYYYYFLHLLITELSILQKSRNDFRFFKRVLPDLNEPDWMRWAKYFYWFLVLLTIVGALFSLFWILNNECKLTCPRRFETYSHLTIAIFILEGIYILSQLAFGYFTRISSLEAILNIAKAFNSVTASDLVSDDMENDDDDNDNDM